jgi:hypothetical protein
MLWQIADQQLWATAAGMLCAAGLQVCNKPVAEKQAE